MTITQSTLIVSLAALIASLAPAQLFAETTVINNVVKANSSSGGNVVTSGEIVNGASRNSISVQTIINGETVEDYSSESDEPVSYERTTTTNTGSVSTKVNSSTTVSVKAQTKNSAVSAGDSSATFLASSTKTATTSALASTTAGVSFISNLLAKIFSYVSLWISFR